MLEMAPVRPSAAPPSASRAMRIVHLAAPGAYGGAESVIQALAAGQAERGHEVHLVAIVDPGAEPPLLAAVRAAGVHVHRVAPPRRAYLRERAEVRALLARIAPDVVHTHGYRADVLHAAGARSLGLATVSTVHGFTGGGWKNRLYEALERRALRRVDAVAAVSAPIARQLAGARVTVVRNAWSPPAPPLSRQEARARLGLGDATFAIGWIGRASQEKGLDVLIDAIRHLSGIDYRVVVIGDGPDLEVARRRTAELDVAERVDLRGAIPQAGRWMPAFDVFVLSSRTEGTPVTLLEAMDAGVPVVATAVGGVPDVVSQAEALLVPPESPPALAAAIRAVHDDRAAAAARAARARQRLETDHAPGPWLDAYDDLYRRVLRGAAA
ncbi:MAG TPA: glycosyltransferase [Longimicrobiaceae bacterium]